MANSLVRDVIERNYRSVPSALPEKHIGVSGGASKTGFPHVYHRSKATSAFKRARQDELAQHSLSESREVLAGTSHPQAVSEDSNASPKTHTPAEDWMAEISRTNEKLVARMGADERANERQDIIDKFGAGIDGLMAKAREARERRAAHHTTPDSQGVSNTHASSSVTSTLPPSARVARKIRFVEPTEADVHVYESQPSSPKRTLGLLPPPEVTLNRDDIMSLDNLKGASNSSVGPSTSLGGSDTESPEEGTPEDIRRRFFPTEAPPEVNPALAWMLPTPFSKRNPPLDHDISSYEQSNADSAHEPRYSLSGARLSSTDITHLPTHLGLHHHAASSSSDAPAGYTMSDLLLLSRSSVPAQRANILGVLTKLLRKRREQDLQYFSSWTVSHEGTFIEPCNDIDLDAMRRDLLDTAVDALGEKGGVGQHGVELLWESIVGFVGYDYGVIVLKDLVHVDLSPKRSRPSVSSTTPSLLESVTKSATNSSPPSLDIMVLLPVAMILPKLRQHLLASPSALSRTHTQVLEILLVLSHFKAHAREIAHTDAGRAMIAAMMEPHLRASFGSEQDESEDTRATPTSIHILQALARSSRDNAMKLMGPADILLRYVTEPRSSSTYAHSLTSGYPSFYLSMGVLEETLRLYDILSQYGLYSQVAAIAQDHFSRTGGWILEAMRNGLDPISVSLSRAYVSLLGTLIICATDPHKTTPSHDILWSQVQGWDWAEWILELAELLAPPGALSLTSSRPSAEIAVEDLWADVFHAAAAWIEGVSLNGIKGGEAEKAAALSRLRPLFETNRGASNAVAHAITTLQSYEIQSALDHSGMHDLAQAAGLLAATTRLAVSCFERDATDKPFQFPDEAIQVFCIRFADRISSQGTFSLVLGHRDRPVLSENAHVFMRPLSSLMVSQLKFWRRSMSLVDTEREISAQSEKWTIQALRVLRVLLPGDEEHAQWIMESICETINPDFVRHTMPTTEIPTEFWDKDGLHSLLPFLRQSLHPVAATDGEGKERGQAIYIAPTSPTLQSISRCTTLSLPALSQLRDAWDFYDPNTALPLRSDWPMLSINHLLRSGTSPVFNALPPSWEASETDVVRASLLLARLVQEVGGTCDAKLDKSRMSPAEAIFACMKIFMLEDGQQQVNSGDEVFRDLFVTRWMEDLLEPFTYSHSQNTSSRNREDHSPPSLEQVSKAFLGAGTPFYQFYADFLALYDAISFSHTLFARLLLPPISMPYPIDYRRLLFGDYGHVLRTVKTDVQDLLCGEVRDYLWPVERDVQVVGWYLKLLVTSQLHGLVRWLAVHHVAANIWPEFTSGRPEGRQRAGRLLSALLLQGNNEVVKEVALYRQREDEVSAPPECFISGEIAWRRARLEWAENIGSEGAKTKLQSLFMD